MSGFEFTLTIAGLTVAFNGNSRIMGSRLINHYRPYLRKRSKPHLRIKCRFSHKPASRNLSVLFVPGPVCRASRYDFAIEWDKAEGSATMHPAISSFDSCVRTLFASELPNRGFLLLHAAAVADKCGTLVFPGPSGSGKSTIAGYAGGHRKVLTDEICAVGKSYAEGHIVSATPFWGELGCGKPYHREFPLRALVFPCKANKDRIWPLPPMDALRKLLRCVCTFSKSPDHTLMVLRIATQLVMEADCSQMGFRKAPDFWGLL